MGLLVKGDFDTNQGKTDQIYTRIESIYFNKTKGALNFSLSYWPDKQTSDKNKKRYIEDDEIKYNNMVDTRVLLYSDSNTPTELNLEHSISSIIAREVEIEVPIHENQVKEVETTYVSFDENGEEVEKTQILKQNTLVQVGTERVKRNRIDLSLSENIMSFCYGILRNSLIAKLPNCEVIDM